MREEAQFRWFNQTCGDLKSSRLKKINIVEKKVSITAALFPAFCCRGLFVLIQTEEADDLFRLE